MASTAGESACHKCGRCCYAKFRVGPVVVNTGLPCRYLDVRTKLCTVYGRRHELNPDCLTVEEGIALGVFPRGCPYVRGVASYRAPLNLL
jgi:uncharacterized cysteine cluster protein YcgN (CxxCxxCC family)